MTAKQLTPEEQFAQTQFTDRDQIIALFPNYMREQFAIRKASGGKLNVSKAVNIESFTLKTPFGDQVLLDDTELVLEANRRQGLVGANGTGKTMLFHNMTHGLIKEFPKHIHVHHCKELETHELSESVLSTVTSSHPFRNILMKVEDKIKQLLAAEPAPADEQRDLLKGNLDFVQMHMRSINGYDAEERAVKMLRVLGFDEVGMKKPCSALSGGLRMRVALCMAFFIDADLLLLDEPTNHLDFPSVLWLENRLRGYRGAFLMVSHDRELLNNVCTSVLLLEDKKIHYYQMGFKEFEKKKAAEDKKKFEDIEKFLQKNYNVDPSTMLGRQRYEKKMWSDNYYQRQIALAGKFTFPTAVPLDNPENLPADDISLINLSNVRFSYDVSTGHFIFNDPISFNVTASSRVGIMGPNGAGKSTLLKLLTHKLTPTEGTVVHHPKFTLAYFGQHSTAELDLEMTPLEFMVRSFPSESSGVLRGHLGKTGVNPTVAEKRMHSLSFSQRACVVFAKLTFVCPHLLILDEPTNFLDLESVDSLIGACNKYKGALLLVSHNRDFLRKCAKQYLSVVPGHFALYDNMKKAEMATYTFIQEMEEGGKVGANALVNTPGGGSVHSSQKVGGAGSSSSSSGEKGVLSISSSGAAPARPASAAAPAVTYAAGEKCQALWKDGKWYAAVIKKVEAGGKYSVTYTAYGNTVTLPASNLKKAAAPAAGAGKAAPAANAKPVAAGRK